MPNTRVNSTSDPGIGFNLDDFLPYQLAVLADCMSRSLSRVYSERFGITIPEWRVLVQLNNESPLSAQEVARRTNMDKPRVSRALARLSNSGLIKRRQDRDDRRVAVLALNARGSKLVAEIIPYAMAWQEQLTELVGAEDMLYLSNISRTVTQILKAQA